MDTLDDLLIKRRRGALSEAEERRLRVAVQSSSEYELSLVTGDAFDREGLPAPGDGELIEAIVNHRGAGAPGKISRLGRRRPAPLWAVVPVFLAGAAAASYGGYRVSNAARAPAPSAPAFVAAREGASRGVTAPAASAGPVEASIAPAEPSEEWAVVSPPPSVVLERPRPARASTAEQPAERRVEPTPPTVTEPERRSAKRSSQQEPPVQEDAPLATAEEAPLATAEEASLATAEEESARAMFRRANRLRGEDWLAAASVYRLLIDRHPASSQAGIAEMALGKRALSEGRLSEALRWFRAHQRRPESALGAEALWGEAQVLERLDRAPEARRSWRTLMQRHPTSTYASVARQRLAQP